MLLTHTNFGLLVDLLIDGWIMDCVRLEVLILLNNSSDFFSSIFTYFLMATPLSVPSSHGSSSALCCTKAALLY